MIDERRVREMACEYDTNHSTARNLLEDARDVPALRRGRWYRLNLAAAQVRMGIEQGIKAAGGAAEVTARIRSAMTGGDAGGQENTEAIQGAEKGTGADRPGNRAPSGAGREHSDGDGEGHRLQP